MKKRGFKGVFRANTGFTLIELLVMVLIIGILAAVALPQYQQAVMKTRFTKLYQLGRIYERAAELYVADHGEWPIHFADLDIDAPGGMEIKSSFSSNCCAQNEELYCCLQTANASQPSGITCGLADYSLGYILLYKDKNKLLMNQRYCIAQNTNSVATKVCTTYNATGKALNLITPTGHKTGYKYYPLPQNL